MDKVLIVDSDIDFLANLKVDLEKLQQFEVLTAADGKEALSCLQNSQISIFVTDIQTPKLECLELLSYMTHNHPGTPCIVTTDWGKPWFRHGLSQQTFLYHLEKPFSNGSIAAAIFVGLNLRDEGLNRSGMTMASVLPLVELQQKTCRMQITSADSGKGYLYFEKGVLFDAHYRDLTGEKAAREISTWQRIRFKLSELPRHRTRKRVKTNLMEIVDAYWKREEAATGPGGDDLPSGGGKEPVIPLKEEVTPFEVDWEKSGNALHELLNEVKAVDGYMALALVDSRGKIFTADQSEYQLNLRVLAKDMRPLYAKAQEAAERSSLGRAESLVLHSLKCIVLMQLFEMNLFIIVVCRPQGQWVEMKSCLDRMMAGSLEQ